MSGTPLSIGQVLLPIMMFIGAGYSAAKAYDTNKANSKMQYFWMLLFVVFTGGGYYTLTKGITLTNVRGMAQARVNAIRGGGQMGAVAPVPQAPGMQPQMVPV